MKNPHPCPLPKGSHQATLDTAKAPKTASKNDLPWWHLGGQPRQTTGNKVQPRVITHGHGVTFGEQSALGEKSRRDGKASLTLRWASTGETSRFLIATTAGPAGIAHFPSESVCDRSSLRKSTGSEMPHRIAANLSTKANVAAAKVLNVGSEETAGNSTNATAPHNAAVA